MRILYRCTFSSTISQKLEHKLNQTWTNQFNPHAIFSEKKNSPLLSRLSSEIAMMNYCNAKVFRRIDAIYFCVWKWKCVTSNAFWIVAFNCFWDEGENHLKMWQESIRLEFLNGCQTSCEFAGYTRTYCMHTWWRHVGRATFKYIAEKFDHSETDCILNVKLLWNCGFRVCWVSSWICIFLLIRYQLYSLL